MNLEHDIERAVLATVMFSDLHPFGEEIRKLELHEEVFKFHFHKITVKVINAMRMKDIPISDELVAHYLRKNGIMHEDNFLSILTATPLGNMSTLRHYAGVLEESSLKGLI